MHTTMIHLILTYGSTVTWQELSKKYNKTKSNRIQSIECEDVIGALNTNPQILLMYTYTCFPMVRMVDNEAGHSNILDQVPREPWNYDKCKLKVYCALSNHNTVHFIDGLKTVCGVDVGVCSDIQSVFESDGLPSVFQGEVLAILEACRWLEHDPGSKRIQAILTDSEVGTTAAYSVVTPFRLVEQLRNALNSMGSRS